MREAIRVVGEVERYRAGWKGPWGAERAAELWTEAERGARTIPPGIDMLEACRQVQEEEILRAMREAPAVQVWACDLDAYEEE